MKRLIGIIFISVGLLLFLFFRHYSGDFLPHPSLLYLIGFILIVIGYLLFNKSKSYSASKKEKLMISEIKRLKQEGKKIKINFKDCKVITTNYYEEVPKNSNYKIQAWDSLYNDSDGVESIEINKSRIIYHYNNYNDNYTYISPIINKDKFSLSFLLEKQKEINLYIDRTDESLYYFDIEFLNSSFTKTSLPA